METVKFILDERVAVVTMNDGENRLNPLFLEAFLEVLNRVENDSDANALVVTSSDKKIFSNGIDLDWLMPIIQKGDKDAAASFLYLMNRLFRRILLYPMPTIASISGHAFAAGAIMSCAFDFRFMRSDRGFFSFPEVDLGIPFLPGMIALIRKAIPMYKVEEMQYTGQRITAEECVAHNIVMKACHIDRLMNEALSFAKGLNKRREIIAEMKKRIYKDIIHAIDVDDPPVIETGMFYV